MRLTDIDKLQLKLREYADRKASNGEIEVANGILKAKCFIDQECTVFEEQQLNSGWIPVSERLPEEREEFADIYDIETLAVIDTRRHMVSDLVQVTVRDHEEDTIFVCDDCFVDGEWSNFDERTGRFEVLAWQPLPEPYKEG